MKHRPPRRVSACRQVLSLSARLGLGAVLLLGACGGANEDAGPPPQVRIDIAALTLTGVQDAVWDLEVVNGATPSSSVVRQRITSSAYGDGAGSASYIGPCDASDGAAANTVRLWLVGIYDQPVAAADAGAFASGSASGVGSVTGSALAVQNPTAGGPLERVVTCNANQDAAVRFDVTVMRQAQQGFFDVAVNFNSIFCSAKFDCCQDGDTNGCASDGSEDIRLLFDASGQRVRTFVLGFACTGGPGSDVATELYLDPLTLDCDINSDPDVFSADLIVNTSPERDGNLCAAGTDGMSHCTPHVLESAGVDADTFLVQAAVYRGTEALTSGDEPANMVYWNVALGVKAPIASCRLRTRGTADDANNDADGFVSGVLSLGYVQPYVTWDVDLGTCGSEQLTFGVEGAPVTTIYTTPSEGHAEPLASCLDIKANDPSAGDGVYLIDPDGQGGGAPFEAYCDMTTDGGGWTLVQQARPSPDPALSLCVEATAGSLDLDDATVSAPAKLANDVINAIWAASAEREVLVKADEGEFTAAVAVRDRACAIDFVSGYEWNTRVQDASLADLDTLELTCFPGGVYTAFTNPYTDATACGFGFRSSFAFYAIQTVSDAFVATHGGGACGSAVSGRSYLSGPNWGCNLTKTFVR